MVRRMIPRILDALDSMARLGTIFEPTLDATYHSVAYFNAKRRHIPSEQEEYVRAASGFGIEVTREAVRRGCESARAAITWPMDLPSSGPHSLESCGCWWTRVAHPPCRSSGSHP